MKGGIHKFIDSVRSLFPAIFLSAPALSGPPDGPLPIVRVRAASNAAVVYDWEKQRCEEWDVPDAPLRAFRNAQGGVTAYASDSSSRPFAGLSILKIRHGCHSSLTSHENPDPSAYSGVAFVTSVWTDDGRVVQALVHNEYHAEHFSNACMFTTSMKCWFTTIVAATSVDAGWTFTEAAPPTVVASVPFRQDFEQGRHRGFFNPSNIVFHQGYYYMATDTTGGAAQNPGLCIFRTATVEDPTSWRGYDGERWTSRAIDPYRADVDPYIPCQPVLGPGTAGSISWSDASSLFLIVYQSADKAHPYGMTVYSWSRDLINWSGQQGLLDKPDMSSKNCGDKFRYGYPSILDPGARGRNFDTVGLHPVLFLTRFHVGNDCGLLPNRDLIRLQVDITYRGPGERQRSVTKRGE